MSTPLDGVAIVGMAGRFPGAASIDEFWRNLICAQESITRFRGEQLSPLVAPELRAHPHYVAARGVVADADRFDAAFFGIAPGGSPVASAQRVDELAPTSSPNPTSPRASWGGIGDRSRPVGAPNFRDRGAEAVRLRRNRPSASPS